MKKITPFAIARKRLKFLGVNLTKEGKDLYTGNYKMVLKKNCRRSNEMERCSVFMDWKN